MEFYKASQWMTLSERAVRRVLQRHYAEPALARYFRTVRIPDEAYVQSILAADPQLRIVAGTTTAHVIPEGQSSPEWLDLQGMTEALASGAPFARKVPPGVDPAVLAVADRNAEAGRPPSERQPADGDGPNSDGDGPNSVVLVPA